MTSISNTNYDYLLKNLYSKDRLLRKNYNRDSQSSDKLVKADSNALNKLFKELGDTEYNSDNGVQIYNDMKAFVETYNNLQSGASKNVSGDIKHATKQLKNLISSNQDALKEIGIKITASGKLDIDKVKLASADPDKIKDIFSNSSKFSEDITRIAKKLTRYARKNLSTGNSAMNTTRINGLPVNNSTTGGIDYQA